MAGRRTRGVAIDYRALDGAESDDDFSVPTPPTKRPRAQKASERAAEFADGAGPSKGRASLDDKLFKKQLVIALEKSRSEAQTTSDASSQEEHSIKSADTLPVSQDEMPETPKIVTRPCYKDTSSQDSADNQDEWAAGGGTSSDDSEESGDDGDNYSDSDDEFKPQPKKAAKKQPVKAKPTKAQNPKAKPLPSSKSAASQRPDPAKNVAASGVPSLTSMPTLLKADVATSGLSSPTSVPPPLLKAVSPVRKSPVGSPVVGGPPPLSRPVLKAVNSAVSSPKRGPATGKTMKSPVLCLPAAPALSSGRSAPKWKPPAQMSVAGASEKRLMSPSSGGLRLGLSRNVRRKPLHPSAKPST